VSPDTYRQIKLLFNQTIELPPAEREEALAQVDPSLRTEIEILIAEAETGEPFLDQPIVSWEFRMRTQLAAMRHTTSR